MPALAHMRHLRIQWATSQQNDAPRVPRGGVAPATSREAASAMSMSAYSRRLFVDPVHRVPRLWSNAQLAQVGDLFDGDVVNVSAWQDNDKDGRTYRSYFPRARSYTLTNFEAGKRGYQGLPDEVFLDLESALSDDLKRRFDVVYNHTTLEHVYEFRRAFGNLCELSRDAVIVVVPWLQPAHSNYGDYWRFSPMAIARLFHENGYKTARITWNGDRNASVYVFAVGVRDQDKWRGKFEFGHDPESADFFRLPNNCAGSRTVAPTALTRLHAAITRRLNPRTKTVGPACAE